MAWQDREREWKNLQAVQQKLGEVSMIWAMIDRRLDMLITDILDISHAEAAAVVSGMLPARKCTILLRLIAIDSPGDEWRAEISDLLNDVSGKFGEERNRLVHDSWRFEQDVIQRVDSTAKLEKVAHKGKVLVFDKTYDVTIEDLKKWCARGYTINHQIGELRPALLPWLLKRREQPSR